MNHPCSTGCSQRGYDLCCCRFKRAVPIVNQFTAILTLLLALLIPLSARAQNNSLVKRLENAASLIRDGRIGEAEQQLNSILKVAPDEAEAFNLLGTIRAKQGRLNEAERLFTRAVRINDQLVSAHMNLAYLYVLEGVPEKTISQLKEVLRLDPNNSDAGSKLASLLLAQNRVDECISFIEKVKQSRPLSVALLVLLGDAYLKKGDLEKGEESYLLALNEQSDSAGVLLGLARISQAKGDAKTALFYLSRAKGQVSDSPDLLYMFALTALKSGLNSEAMAAIKKALELRPEEPSYLFVLGVVWLTNKKPDLVEAEQAFRRFLKLQPNSAQGQLHLGYILLKQKKYTEARDWLERSIKIDKSVPEAYYYLGLIAQDLNEDQRALEFLEKAVQLSPSYAFAHIALGSSYLKLKNYPRAQQELELAVKLNPSEPKVHYHLAMLYARLKDQRRSQEEMAIVEKLKNEQRIQAKEGDAVIPTAPDPR